jgi:NAD-dependent deacetylase
LAELEDLGLLKYVITQNIDGLHRKAGSRGVIELHGSLREINCLECQRTYLAPNVPDGTPPYCECGGILKPNTVLFGEQLPPGALESAYQETVRSRVMLLIGTSAVVQPAASLPYLAKQNGAAVVEVNPEKAFDEADFFFADKAGTVVPEILVQVKRLM